jgi:hypothetical protein
LMHHVGIEQAYQAAEKMTQPLPKYCNKNTDFCRMLLAVRESTSQWWRL